MTASQPDWVQLPSGLWVLDFNGTDAVVDVGAVGQPMKTATMWIYSDDITTRSFMDLDGGTHSLEINGSGNLTATGWASPTFYVDAVAAAVAISLQTWHFIMVTTATEFSVSDFDIGREAAAYFDGMLALLSLHAPVLTAGQGAARYQAERHWFGV
jgi:hypothetical protein